LLVCSFAFAVPPSGEQLDRFNRVRRITRADLRHIALVAEPAYAGAKVLTVRSSSVDVDLAADPLFVWARFRADPLMQWARRRARY